MIETAADRQAYEDAVAVDDGVRTQPMRITCRMLASGRACHLPDDSLGGLPHRLGDEQGRLLQDLRARGHLTLLLGVLEQPSPPGVDGGDLPDGDYRRDDRAASSVPCASPGP